MRSKLSLGLRIDKKEWRWVLVSHDKGDIKIIKSGKDKANQCILELNKIKKSPLFFGLSMQAIKYSSMEVPKDFNEKTIEAQLELKSPSLFGVSYEELLVSISNEVFSQDEKRIINVEAVKKSTVNHCFKTLKPIRHKPFFIGTEVSGLASLAELFYQVNKAFCIVQVTYDALVMLVYYRDEIVIEKLVPINAFAEEQIKPGLLIICQELKELFYEENITFLLDSLLSDYESFFKETIVCDILKFHY